MRLYDISREEIEETIEAPDAKDKEGRYDVAYKTFPERFGSLPLKVLYILEDEPIVISAYPLRRVRWREQR